MRDDLPPGESGLLVRSLVAGPLENNVYLAACPATGRALLIDPADDAARILEMTAGWEVEAILLTHGHHDHLGAAVEVSRALAAPLRLHPADATLAGLAGTLPLADGERIRLRAPDASRCATPRATPPGRCAWWPRASSSAATPCSPAARERPRAGPPSPP